MRVIEYRNSVTIDANVTAFRCVRQGERLNEQAAVVVYAHAALRGYVGAERACVIGRFTTSKTLVGSPKWQAIPVQTQSRRGLQTRSSTSNYTYVFASL
jgi:hypothetical protein